MPPFAFSAILIITIFLYLSTKKQGKILAEKLLKKP